MIFTLMTATVMFVEMHLGIWWEHQNERDHYEDAEVGGTIILKWILEKQNGLVWTGFIWIMTGTSGELL
jgi:hypothetical protein